MPLLKKKPFKKRDPPPGLQPDDEVFFCEATKEVFKDYESFFQRTILCNSLVWSCSVTGKSNLTYDEAVESEAKARKRLGDIPKPLKRGLLWLADHTSRGKINDVVDDVYVFANARFFIGEVVEGIINDQWCDCKVLKVIPPTQEEIDKDAEEDREEEEKAAKEGSPSKKKPKKTFFPPDHLFKYELQEVEPDNPDDNPVLTIPADDIRREKGTFTREKNLLFLKNILDLESNGTLVLNQDIRQKYKLAEMSFTDIFAGPEPVFEVTKRGKSGPPGRKSQGTLDGWVTGKSSNSSKGSSGNTNKVKKQSPAEIEAEMRRMKEQNQRFKEEMKQRAEEARKQKMEEKAKEKERKKEETRLVRELLTEWKKPREDLECEDLKALPEARPVHCKIPNHLFGDFLGLLEFFNSFAGVLETNDTFSHGVTFKILEKALGQSDSPTKGGFYEILRFMLQALFDLQQEEDEEVRLDAKNLANVNVLDLDKNILGKDEDIANQIRSATQMARWCMKHQGQPIKSLHMDEHSISEILRLHLESSGAYRSDKSLLWLYQQRGGYKLSDDPGLQFRMDEPQILEALTTHTVYELSLDDKMKILHCLQLQIMSYATVRDEIDEKFNELTEAKSELRNHQIGENKRQKQFEEAEKAKRKEEKIQKKEEELKEKEATEPQKASEKQTDRQKEAVLAQKEKEEKDRLRKEEIQRSIAYDTERELMNRVAELRHKAGPHCLGRDRAYRRFWILESLPGLYVEHDDEFVGECLPNPTKIDPDAQPMDEARALLKVRQMLDVKSEDSKGGSDKENDNQEEENTNKTYAKKPVLNSQQKVLSTKNGTLEIASTSKPELMTSVNGEVVNGDVIKSEILSSSEPMSVDIKPEIETKLKPEMWGICIPDKDKCTVHSTILPKTHWSYISSVEDFDKLIESLNPRGIREGELKEKLVSERESITKHIKEFENDLEDKLQLEDAERNTESKEKEDISAILDLAMRDAVLEIEEKIFFGTMGSLKIRDRAAWQRAISEGGYDKQCETLTWGGKSMMNTPYESRMVSASASRENSRPGSPDRDSGNSFVKRQNEKIRGLASAILQIAQMMDIKYFKSPLGEDEKDKKKRLKEEEKRKKEADEASEANAEAEPVKAQEILTPLQEWENSLMSSTSYAQLFVHLTSLDSSILWSKSILNTKCRICRRKCDPDKMLLCDGCDHGYHMYCLKPKLTKIPVGDWYCHYCKPKERIKSPKKKSRQVFSTEEREEDQDEDMDTTEANESENEEDQQAEEHSSDENNSDQDEEDKDEETPPRRTKKSKRSVDPAPKKAKKSSQKKGLSQLLGKRKSAAEASEKIKTFVAETGSGHSSSSEDQPSKKQPAEISSASGERQSSRLRTRTSKSNLNSMETKAAKLKEQRLSDDFVMSSKISKSRCKRRRGAGLDDELLTMYNPSALEDLLNNMMKHKDGWPFDRPITKADAPDYFDIVQRPMDLGTVRSTLLQMKYSCNQEVLQDIRQVFKNCYLYNREDTEEYQCAMRLEKYFDKEGRKLGLLEEDFEDENQPLSKKARRTL